MSRRIITSVDRTLTDLKTVLAEANTTELAWTANTREYAVWRWQNGSTFQHCTSRVKYENIFRLVITAENHRRASARSSQTRILLLSVPEQCPSPLHHSVIIITGSSHQMSITEHFLPHVTATIIIFTFLSKIPNSLDCAIMNTSLWI